MENNIVNGNVPHENEEDEKPRTVFVGNIPATTSKWDIESIFGEIGPLKRCYIQYPKNFNRTQSESTVAYVTYALSEDATAAIDKLSGHSIGTNKLSLKLSKSRSLETRPKSRPKFPSIGLSISRGEGISKEKQPRVKTPKKKSRLIIRNLPFQITEEKLKNHFKAFGDIQDINILKKANGKLVGCAFIQYAKVSQAAKALRDLNLQPLMGRPIAIDWALPKSKFQSDVEIPKKEDDEKPDVEVTDVKIKDEPLDSDDVDVKEDKKIHSRNRKRKNSSSSDSESDQEFVDSDDENDMRKAKIRKTHPNDNDDDEKKKSNIRKINPNDADEGRTLFIRNLNFDTTSENLKEYFLQFGPINYAVICKDRLTEHSKGTAFVSFRRPDDLQKCLAKYEEDPGSFMLDERQFYVSLAMSKSKLSEKLDQGTHKEPKDKRNLFLVREGFIRPGTTAADGISAGDLNLRATLHQHKRQMLKDLNNFISDKRLCIHNLPENYSDSKLRSLFLKHGGPGAIVTEARIMRDRNVVSGHDFKSKNFGFVTFTEHGHALAALRALNNNPNIFTKHKRPVVEFSLEKRAALKAKEKRAEKSRERLKEIEEQKLSNENNKKKKRQKKRKLEEGEKEKMEQKTSKPKPDVTEVPEFGGLASKAGLSTIPKLKPKGKTLTPSKPKIKKLKPRRKRELKSVSRRNSKGDDDKFEKTVQTYREKNYGDSSVLSGKSKKKSKWYATTTKS